MIDSEWVRVDAKDLHSSSEQRTVNGVEIEIGLSPFDIPKRVRGGFDESLDRFVVEFMYLINDEPKKEEKLDDNLTVIVGKHSDCLYEIRIDVNRLGANLVSLKVRKNEPLRREQLELLTSEVKDRFKYFEDHPQHLSSSSAQMRVANEAMKSLVGAI